MANAVKVVEPVEEFESFLNLCSEHGIENVLKNIHDVVGVLQMDVAPDENAALLALRAKLKECFALASKIDRMMNE